MRLSPPARKFVLVTHLSLSVGWIGAVVAYLALGVAATTSDNTETIRSAWTAMELVGWTVIVPMAVGSLLTGILIAHGANWGLFRHYWVILSLVLTLFATVVLLLHMPSVSSMADEARRVEGAQLKALGGDLFHPGAGLLVLIVIEVLNVYKPRGVTQFGRRKQAQERAQRRQRRDAGAGEAASSWR